MGQTKEKGNQKEQKEEEKASEINKRKILQKKIKLKENDIK